MTTVSEAPKYEPRVFSILIYAKRNSIVNYHDQYCRTWDAELDKRGYFCKWTHYALEAIQLAAEVACAASASYGIITFKALPLAWAIGCGLTVPVFLYLKNKNMPQLHKIMFRIMIRFFDVYAVFGLPPSGFNDFYLSAMDKIKTLIVNEFEVIKNLGYFSKLNKDKFKVHISKRINSIKVTFLICNAFSFINNKQQFECRMAAERGIKKLDKSSMPIIWKKRLGALLEILTQSPSILTQELDHHLKAIYRRREMATGLDLIEIMCDYIDIKNTVIDQPLRNSNSIMNRMIAVKQAKGRQWRQKKMEIC